MINYKEFKDNNYFIKSIKKINNSYLIDDGNQKYIVKKNKTNLIDTFNYLASRSFNSFPKYFKLNDYDVFEYKENSNISEEEKLYEIVNLLALLHLKTTRYSNTNLDDYKIIYEDILNKLNYLNDYYTELNNYIDSEIYFSPAQYILVRNISKIYSALSFCKNELDNWYDDVKTSTKTRKVLIHNNIDLSHALYNKVPYLINFNESKIDLPIYDLVKLYQKSYKIVDFSTLLNNYQSKYPLSSAELKLLFILISIPDKIVFTSDQFESIKNIKLSINKIIKSDELIKPFYTKQKESKT